MAKKVAAQRRGMLYGMIAAIFVAVVMTVLTFVQAGQVQESNQFLANPKDPQKVLDTKGVQAKALGVFEEAVKKGYADANMGLAEALKAAMDEADTLRARVDGLTMVLSATPASGKEAADIAARVAAKGNTTLKLVQAELKNEKIDNLDKLPLDGVIPHLIRLAQKNRSDKAIQEEAVKAKDEQLQLEKNQHAESIKAKETEMAAMGAANAQAIKDIEAKIAAAVADAEKIRGEYEAARKAHNDDLELHKKQLQAKDQEIPPQRNGRPDSSRRPPPV